VLFVGRVLLARLSQRALLLRVLHASARPPPPPADPGPPVPRRPPPPALRRQLFSGNATLRKVREELADYSDYSLHAFCYNAGPEFAAHRLTTAHLMASTKFRFLADILPKLKEAGSRPLIFSQWTAVLDVVEWLMDELRLPYVRLDGSTAVDERLATVDKFNLGQDDVFAFLLSTRAGGQGLNLTGADTVILHDVDFNPQIDRQAEDRCHRLGQTKPVRVYRLITKHSVDQNIFNLSQRKLKLDAAVLDGITSGRGAKQRENAQERQQMGFILHSLFAGKDEYAAMMATPDEIEEEQRAKAAAADEARRQAKAEAKTEAAAAAAEAEAAQGVEGGEAADMQVDGGAAEVKQEAAAPAADPAPAAAAPAPAAAGQEPAAAAAPVMQAPAAPDPPPAE
jgi:superfamily II DNA/RNA helicase